MRLMIYFSVNGNILTEKSFKTKSVFLQTLDYFVRYDKMKVLPEVSQAFCPLIWLTAGICRWHNFPTLINVKPIRNIWGVPGFGALEQI